MGVIYTWPDELVPNEISFGKIANTGIFESPLNKSVRTHRYIGERWRASMTFGTLDNNTIRELDILEAFLFKLGGMSGRFMMGTFYKKGAPAKGNPVVIGNNQMGGLLQTGGWTPNRVVIPMGQYFSVNGELKMAINDITSNAGGVATLEFTPWLRKSPLDGDAIVTDNPMGMFRLASDDQSFGHVAGNSEITIDVVEAFNV